MPRVFVSYARDEMAVARRFAEDLRAAGVDVWRDMDNIVVGTDWEQSLVDGLESADFLLLLISPSSIESRYVTQEWRSFLLNEKPVIPVIVRPIEPAKLHFLLNRLQLVDATRAEDYDKALALILSVIRRQQPVRLSVEEARERRRQVNESLERALASGDEGRDE